MRLFLGVDPGKSGAYAVINEKSEPVFEVRGKESCFDRAAELREAMVLGEIVFALLERVSAMPGQGVSSTFKFGQSFGEAIGILESLSIRYELVQPAKWQQELGCRTKGDKNVSKHKAQMLFPDYKMIHANADAFLIAEYARRLAVLRGLV